MLLEMLVLAVAAVAGYQGQLIFRRGGPENRTYAIMLMGVAVVGAVAFSGLAQGGDGRAASELLGIVTVGSFVCLVMVPSVLRDQARRALGRDQVKFARWLLTLRELLQPGAVARQERDYVNTIAEVRAGRVDEALADLQERRVTIEDPLARRALDERVVLALLFARRYKQAIEHFERRLQMSGAPITAQLTVELIGAFGEQDDLNRAAEMLVYLENSPMAADLALGFLIMRARMIFLAFVGRPADVETIVGKLSEIKPRRRQAGAAPLSSLPVSHRAYWMAVAHSRAGDVAAAERAFSIAANKARDSLARKLVEDKLASLKDRRPAQPGEEVSELADRVVQAVAESKGTALPLARGVFATAPVTVALCAVNVLVAVLLLAFFDDPQDMGVLVSVGANVDTAVRAGEWWRLHAATFLHGGGWHLLFNVYGLWILGKLLEPMLGRRAFFAVYAVAGLGGSVAAVLLSKGFMMSVGASGAVMGLLGALLSEIYLRHKLYPPQWRKMMLGNIVFIVLLQLGIGLYPQVDQAAHIGGFIVGLLVAPLLSPRGRIGASRIGRATAVLLVVAGLASFGYSGIGLAQKRNAGWQRRDIGGLSLQVPGSWVPWGGGKMLAVDLGYPSNVTVDMQQERDIAKDVDGLVKAELTKFAAPPETREARGQATTVALDGWSSGEQTLAGDGQPLVRHVVYVRVEGARQMVINFLVIESRIDDLAKQIPRILNSARPTEKNRAGP